MERRRIRTSPVWVTAEESASHGVSCGASHRPSPWLGRQAISLGHDQVVDRRVDTPARYPQVRQSAVPTRCAHGLSASYQPVDKPVETVDSRVIAGLNRPPNLHRVPQIGVLNWASTTTGRAPARYRRLAGVAQLPVISIRIRQTRSLGWSGDSGVLPVRNALERARSAARVVPALQRRADGARPAVDRPAPRPTP